MAYLRSKRTAVLTIGLTVLIVLGGCAVTIKLTYAPGIAFDNATYKDTSGLATILTFSHLVSFNANRILFVGVRTCCTNGLIPSVSYNGTALAFINSKDSLNPDNGGTAYLYYLVNPPSGPHDVVITLATDQRIFATAVSYTGVDQKNPIDVEEARALQIATGQTYTQSLTTRFAGDWALLAGVCDGGPISPASGSVLRGSTFANAGMLVDSGGPINPPGPTSLGYYDDLIRPRFASVMVAIKNQRRCWWFQSCN